MQVPLSNGYYVTVNGVFEYNPDHVPFYTINDVIYFNNPDNNNELEFFVCIRNPAGNVDIYDPRYFVPIWYYNIVNNFADVVRSINTNDLDRPVSKRILEAIQQYKFGTGYLVADASSFEGTLDLNAVKRTGRYVILLEKLHDVKNFPGFILSEVASGRVSRVFGLDVYGDENNCVQVLFSNVGNKIMIAIREGSIDNQGIFVWGNWTVMRNSINIQALNSYVRSIDNIRESYFNVISKQSYGVLLEYDFDNGDLVINLSSISTSIFKAVKSLMINCHLTTSQNPNVALLYNHLMPVPANFPFTYKTFFYNKNIDVAINNQNIVLMLSQITSDPNTGINNIIVNDVLAFT